MLGLTGLGLMGACSVFAETTTSNSLSYEFDNGALSGHCRRTRRRHYPACPRSSTLRPGLRPKEWPLRGSTTSRSAITDRRHLSGGTSAGGHALWSQTGRGSATATVLIRSPYSCCLQRRGWAPCSPQGTRHLRPVPGTSASLHPPVPGHPHFDNLLSIGDVQAPSAVVSHAYGFPA
jgi:hypothetical protein